MVTVIYKSPQDLALSDRTFITLSFIHIASARQACLLFLELSYLGGLCCTHFRPTLACNVLFSRWLLRYLPLFLQVFGDRLLPKRGPGWNQRIPGDLEDLRETYTQGYTADKVRSTNRAG